MDAYRIRRKLDDLGGRWFGCSWQHTSGLVGVTVDDDEAYISKTSTTGSREYANLLLTVLDIVEEKE